MIAFNGGRVAKIVTQLVYLLSTSRELGCCCALDSGHHLLQADHVAHTHASTHTHATCTHTYDVNKFVFQRQKVKQKHVVLTADLVSSSHTHYISTAICEICSMMSTSQQVLSTLRRACTVPTLVPLMLVKTSCRLSRSIVYTAADAVGSYLCDSDKVACAGLRCSTCPLTAQVDTAVLSQVVVELSFQDEKEIASQAGLGFSPSPLDFATLPWLQPARLALLVQIQVWTSCIFSHFSPRDDL